MSDTEAFLAFKKYDFDNDEKFKAGLANILKNQEGSKEDILEKAKWFYYTKFVEAFDFEAYKEWKKEEGGIEEEKEKDTKKESVYTTTVDGEKITVPPKFSFQEIVEMIETGKEIPGIRQIPNQLNEGTPSQPKLSARPKPWEKTDQ
ncbi:unnamed protein product [Cunninghamella blakesleeana]